MSYEVKAHGRIGPALQRVAGEELAAARQHLRAFRDVDVSHATHEARKHFKKIRALLRMIRNWIRKDAFEIENRCYRDAGRRLRDLRDAHVLVQQLDALRGRFFNGHAPAVLSHARRLFVAAEHRGREHLATGETLPALLQELEAASGRIRHWTLDGFGWKEARGAIQGSYRRARRAFRRAVDDPRATNLHEWRKRSKDLWYQARLLRRACPAFMEEFAHDLELLTDFVGDDHDFAVLQNALEERSKVIKHPRQLETFCKMIDLRRRELIAAAFDLGERLFAPGAADFACELDAKREARRCVVRKTKKLAPRLRSRAVKKHRRITRSGSS